MSFAVRRDVRRRVSPVNKSRVGGLAGRVEASNYLQYRHMLDRFLALVLLVPGLPVILAAVVLVRLSSRGPGIYRQMRVGQYGRHFVMYKIRSMRHDAEARTGPVWTQKRDPRITTVGRLIRSLHLDEFPQLLNVIKGDMALIGPRPERPEFVQQLARQIPGYLDRLVVRPGITGLAQINLEPDTDVECVKRKLRVDLEYVRRGGAWLDLRIFLCTFIRLLGVKGIHASRLFGLGAPPVMADADPERAAAARHGVNDVHRASLRDGKTVAVVPQDG